MHGRAAPKSFFRSIYFTTNYEDFESPALFMQGPYTILTISILRNIPKDAEIKERTVLIMNFLNSKQEPSPFCFNS